MPTRLYLPSSGAAPVSPAFDGAWEETTSADRLLAVTARSGTPMASKTHTQTTSTTSNRDHLLRQYVSAVLEAGQSISGTCKGILRVQESATGQNAMANVIARLWNGSSFLTLYAGTAATTIQNEFATSLTNRRFPLAWAGAGQAITTQTARENDRIVLEFGFRSVETSATAFVGTGSFGDSAGTDCAEDETSTAANNPWFEFSADLRFRAVTPPDGRLRGSFGFAPVLSSRW